jgi:hypothetical protein
MAPDDEPMATRREVDQLRAELHSMHSDTTAIAVLGTQLSVLARDVTDFKSDITDKLKEHEAVHEKEQQSRVVSRRWLVSIGITALGMSAAIASALFDILSKIH